MFCFFLKKLYKNPSLYNLRQLHSVNKYAKKRKQYSIGLVTLTAVCGFVYFEIQILHQWFSTVTNVFETEKKNSKYIYLDPSQQETFGETKKRKDLKKKLSDFFTDKSVKYIPWIYTTEEDPESLIKLTRSKDQQLRHLGVQALSEHHDLPDYQYRSIAQSLDSRTWIGLARSENVDQRFFLPMPKSCQNKEWLEDDYRTLLSSLKDEDLDKCLKHFATKALQLGSKSDDRDSLYSLGGDGFEFRKLSSAVPEERVESICLQALASHSVDFKLCQNIVNMDGIQLLHQTYNKRHSNVVVERQIAKILGNLAVHQCFHREIVRAGWVTVLSQWMESSDLTLCLHAARTLANLDRDFVSCVYEDGVYLIHPIHRQKESIQADIVFVHGILGGPFKTWRQKDSMNPEVNKSAGDTRGVEKGLYTYCWPKDWLAEDCENIRILSVEYDTDLSTWNINCPFETEKRSLQARSSSLLKKLQKADIGSRPIIWIGHSMGGLLVKQILSTADGNHKLSRLVNNTVGVVFYSTPHKGSTLAHISKQARFIVAPTVEVQELGRDSVMLKNLHRDFLRIADYYGINCLSFGESEKTNIKSSRLKLLVVPLESSDPGIGKFHELKTDHLNVCKPMDRESKIYQETVQFIQELLTRIRIGKLLGGMPFTESRK